MGGASGLRCNSESGPPAQCPDVASVSASGCSPVPVQSPRKNGWLPAISNRWMCTASANRSEGLSRAVTDNPPRPTPGR